MRGLGDDSNSDISKKFENFICHMARAILHQKYHIVIGKFLESPQFVEGSFRLEFQIFVWRFVTRVGLLVSIPNISSE
jgi:hypothetical protein